MKPDSVKLPLSGNPAEYRFTVKDYLVSDENFKLYADEKWDMLFTLPIPENLEKYYQSGDYKPHSHHSKSLLDRVYNWVRNRNYAYKYKLIKKFNPKAQSVLDYGTATGEFLYYLSKKTFLVSGVEPNKNARELANILLDNKVSVSINNISQKFDVITLWHVLEHIPEPDKLITELKKRLNPDGIILIAVPNFKSYDAKVYGAYWAAYDVPRHLWHFSPTAINNLFLKHKMTVLSQKPLYFDSFYVSLLSEQYKTGKKRALPAFYNGLISNIKARKTGQYSSLIYVIK